MIMAQGTRPAPDGRRRSGLPLWGLLLCLVLTSTPALADPPAFEPPSASARCPVCGMFVAPFSGWIATVQFADTAPFYFDGPKDMFNYLFSRATYHPNGTLPSITGVFVTEYYTQRGMPADDVYFIAGSNVLGPMGQELVPVAGKETALTFVSDHGGQRVMVFDGSDLKEVNLDE